MPGTILVSVLEFMGLPSSSISIKVSLGKTEYQTWEKGDFSLFLQNVTFLLTIHIHIKDDAFECVYVLAGIEIKSIVEKGLWDDIFPLEGGGQVHLKLQFVLNEDERNRIRMMRESALRKKHGELLDFRTLSVEGATNDGNKVASYLCHEISDKNEETSSAIPLSPTVDTHLSKLSRMEVEKVEAQSLIANVPTSLKESTSSVGSSAVVKASEIPPTLQEDMPCNPKKRDIEIHSKPSLPTTAWGSGQLEELIKTKERDKGTNISSKIKLKLEHKDQDKEEEKSHEDMMRMSKAETSSAAERMLYRHRHQRNASDTQDSFLQSGTWIFPDQLQQFCITTGGKKLRDLLGGYNISSYINREKNSKPQLGEKPSDDGGAGTEVSRSKKIGNVKKSKPESEDIGSSRGPVGQAVKIAIMVGFGVFVLLTRQRNNRYKRK
ncbi:hypothetical protein UlMin_022084 [Ulmus minor]